MNIKLLSDKAKVPNKGTSSSAGYDLYSIEKHELKPGERKTFKTGISIAIPNGFYGRIAPRSGLAVNKGIDVLAGIIDSDYRGEIMVALINLGNESVVLPLMKEDKETAIAQIIFEKHHNVNFDVVDNLDSTFRGSGGFGSTDTNQSENSIMENYKKQSTYTPEKKYLDLIKEREEKINNL
jgi:dUTP pyrophosphatase